VDLLGEFSHIGPALGESSDVVREKPLSRSPPGNHTSNIVEGLKDRAGIYIAVEK
jgi:hypothetical protein